VAKLVTFLIVLLAVAVALWLMEVISIGVQPSGVLAVMTLAIMAIVIGLAVIFLRRRQ
jgi:hypothetical protein